MDESDIEKSSKLEEFIIQASQDLTSVIQFKQCHSQSHSTNTQNQQYFCRSQLSLQSRQFETENLQVMQFYYSGLESFNQKQQQLEKIVEMSEKQLQLERRSDRIDEYTQIESNNIVGSELIELENKERGKLADAGGLTDSIDEKELNQQKQVQRQKQAHNMSENNNYCSQQVEQDDVDSISKQSKSLQQLSHQLKAILYMKYSNITTNSINIQTVEDQIPEYLRLLRQCHQRDTINSQQIQHSDEIHQQNSSLDKYQNGDERDLQHGEDKIKGQRDEQIGKQQQQQQLRESSQQYLNLIQNTPTHQPVNSTQSSKSLQFVASQQLYVARMFATSGYDFVSVNQHIQSFTQQIYQQMLFVINLKTLHKIYRFIIEHQREFQIQSSQQSLTPILTQTIYNNIKLPLIRNKIIARQSYLWRVYKYFLLKTHIEEKNKKLENGFVPFQKQLVKNLYLLILSYTNHQQEEGNHIICQKTQKKIEQSLRQNLQDNKQSEQEMINKTVNKEQSDIKKIIVQPQQQHTNKIHVKSIIHLMDDDQKPSQSIRNQKAIEQQKSTQLQLLKSKIKEYHSIDKQSDDSDRTKQLNLLKEKLQKLKSKRVDNLFVEAINQQPTVKAKCFVFKSSPVTVQQVHHSFLQQYVLDNGQLLTAYSNIKCVYPQFFTQKNLQQGPYSKSSFKNLIRKVCQESFEDLYTILSDASKRELQNFAFIIKKLDKKNICQKIVIQTNSLLKEVKISLIGFVILKNKLKFAQLPKPTSALLHETLSKCIKCFYRIIQCSNKKEMVKGLRLQEDLLANLNITLEKFVSNYPHLIMTQIQAQSKKVKSPQRSSSQQSRQKLIQQIKLKSKYQDSEFHSKSEQLDFNHKQNSIIVDKNAKDIVESKKRSYEDYIAGRTFSQEQSIRSQSPKVFQQSRKFIKPNVQIKEQRNHLTKTFPSESHQSISKESTPNSNIIQQSSQSQVEVLQMQQSSKNHKKAHIMSNISSIFKATISTTNPRSEEINKLNTTQRSSDKNMLSSHEPRQISILPSPQSIPPSSIISQRISSLFQDFEKLNRRVNTKQNQIDISDEKNQVFEL